MSTKICIKCDKEKSIEKFVILLLMKVKEIKITPILIMTI